MDRKETIMNTEWDKQKKFIKLNTGINMAYVERGNHEGENVIMLHGYSDSSRSYMNMMRAMENKYHVYAVDLRGHGDTDKPKQFIYTMEQHVEDVTAFLNQLGIEKFYVIGHSMGTLIAQGIGFSLPDRVKGIFLTSPLARFHHNSDDMKSFDLLYEGFAENPPAKEEWIPNYKAYFDQEFTDYLIEAAAEWPGYCWKAAWYGLESVDFTKFIYKITAPVMLVWGGMDDLVTKEHQEELKELLPNAEYKIYPDNTHELNLEIPDIINDVIGFFEKIGEE